MHSRRGADRSTTPCHHCARENRRFNRYVSIASRLSSIQSKDFFHKAYTIYLSISITSYTLSKFTSPLSFQRQLIEIDARSKLRSSCSLSAVPERDVTSLPRRSCSSRCFSPAASSRSQASIAEPLQGRCSQHVATDVVDDAFEKTQDSQKNCHAHTTC